MIDRIGIGGLIGCLLIVSGRGDLTAAEPELGKAAETRLDFPTRILPILTKAGCNAGACHGAAVGQGGFKLSLLGYDPDQDYETITRELGGRRIDLDNPDQSLILRKPTRQLRHKGGLRIKKESADYEMLTAWIRNGAQFGPRDLRVESVRVEPSDVLVDHLDASVQLRVTAVLSNGTSEEVTSHALFSSNDDAIAEVNEIGNVTVHQPGLTVIMVRYSGKVAAVRIGAPLSDLKPEAISFTSNNYVDDCVLSELKRLRIPSSPMCDDAEFLRRVYLDVIGRLPSITEARTFLHGASNGPLPANASESKARRERLIDDLLKRDEFTDFWTLKLADLFLINSKKLGEGPAKAYYDWLHEQVSKNNRLDRLVSDLLTAQGEYTKVGPANFHRLTRDPRDMGEFVSRAFLGVQIACARCHTHPFAGWTQDDYHRFAAFFARTDDNGHAVLIKNHGEVQHPKTGKDLAPRALGDREDQVISEGDRRTSLAAWITSPKNPMLARSFVNRVWKQLLGRGLVEPTDDMRVTNPPSNPALLDALAADFVGNGFDLRRLIRVVVSSQTYQLSSRTNEINARDDRLFSHALLKPLAAQVLADAVAQVTEVPDRFNGYPAGARAVQLIDSQVPSFELDVFGRCPREMSCENTTRFGGGISQALHLVNSSNIEEKLRNGVVNRLLIEFSSTGEMIEELYLGAFSRYPTSDERSFCAQTLARTNDKRAALEDLLWVMINSREFAYVH